MTLSNTSSSCTVKFNDVVSIILNEEVYRKTKGESSSSGNELNMEDKGRTVKKRPRPWKIKI